MNSRAGLIAWVFLLAAAGCPGEKPPVKTPATPTVTIRGKTWTVELAVNTPQRHRGLSGRTEMPEGRGMLFVYPDADVRAFCMRLCEIDLDIAFIGPDRRVVKTYTMKIEPDRVGRVPYSSIEPAQFVLETAAGALERAGVKAGDRVEFSSGIDSAKALPDVGR